MNSQKGRALSKTPKEIKSRIRSILWDLLQREQWIDLDDFSLKLTDRLFEGAMAGKVDNEVILKEIRSVRTNFFIANSLTKTKLAKALLGRSSDLDELVREINPPLHILDLFPEIVAVKDLEADKYLPLIIDEKFLQDDLRNILREKGGSPIPDRGKDTAQEVADVEHFQLVVRGRSISVAIVVKGYRSVSHATLIPKDIMHQITRPFQRTKPDYILLFSAKEPADGLITTLQEYSQSVGRPNLVIFVPPRDFVRLLISHDLFPRERPNTDDSSRMHSTKGRTGET